MLLSTKQKQKETIFDKIFSFNTKEISKKIEEEKYYSDLMVKYFGYITSNAKEIANFKEQFIFLCPMLDGFKIGSRISCQVKDMEKIIEIEKDKNPKLDFITTFQNTGRKNTLEKDLIHVRYLFLDLDEYAYICLDKFIEVLKEIGIYDQTSIFISSRGKIHAYIQLNWNVKNDSKTIKFIKQINENIHMIFEFNNLGLDSTCKSLTQPSYLEGIHINSKNGASTIFKTADKQINIYQLNKLVENAVLKFLMLSKDFAYTVSKSLLETQKELFNDKIVLTTTQEELISYGANSISSIASKFSNLIKKYPNHKFCNAILPLITDAKRDNTVEYTVELLRQEFADRKTIEKDISLALQYADKKIISCDEKINEKAKIKIKKKRSKSEYIALYILLNSKVGEVLDLKALAEFYGFNYDNAIHSIIKKLKDAGFLSLEKQWITVKSDKSYRRVPKLCQIVTSIRFNFNNMHDIKKALKKLTKIFSNKSQQEYAVRSDIQRTAASLDMRLEMKDIVMLEHEHLDKWIDIKQFYFTKVNSKDFKYNLYDRDHYEKEMFNKMQSFIRQMFRDKWEQHLLEIKKTKELERQKEILKFEIIGNCVNKPYRNDNLSTFNMLSVFSELIENMPSLNALNTE